MIAFAFFAIGAVVSALLWKGFEPTYRSVPALQRRNYRDHELPVASGVVMVLAVALVGAVYSLQVRYGGWSAGEARRQANVGGAAISFGFIGLVDDLIGGATRKGFRGHLGALLHGEITTGLVKLVFGVLFGMLLVGLDLGESIRGGLLIAAAANLANLFDRAPGRVIKVSLVGAVLVAALGAPGWQLTGPMVIIGAGLGLLVPDLRERCMLGDTGSNVLGAAIGWGFVLSLGPTGEWIALAVVIVFNLVSEFVSFTRVIDAVAPLRWLDRLGTLAERRSHDATIRAVSERPSI